MYTAKILVLVAVLTRASGYVGSSQASLANFDPLSPTGEGCVDPQGLRDHATENLQTFVSCGERCQLKEVRGMRSVSECQSGCKDNQYMDMLLGWVQACWNQVFSCQYQMTAIIYNGRSSSRNSLSGGVPFYPAPPGAEGACSCNLGWVEGNKTTAEVGINSCVALSFDRNAGVEASDCMCCATSSVLSGINICPKSDLSFFGFTDGPTSDLTDKLTTTDNCAILDKTPGDCVSKYNFSSTGVAAVNPFKLPALGKEPLSNGPGNAFTDGSKEVVTVSIDGFTPKTLTLAAWKDAASAATTGTGKATATGNQAGATGTGTTAGQSGASTAATPTNAAGMVGAPKLRWAGGLFALLFWRMW